MPSRRDPWPVPMRRVAVVAPESRARRVLVEVAGVGTFEPDRPPSETAGPVATLVRTATGRDRDPDGDAPVPTLSALPVDVDALAAESEWDLLLGEASLEACRTGAMSSGRCIVLPGWTPADDLDRLRAAVAPVGGSIADLPGRRGLVPPTAYHASRAGTAFRPLVTTYATVPYRDVDPTLFAAVAYLVMFGMMFGDVAHGLAIVALGLIARSGRPTRFRAAPAAAPFLVGAGLSAAAFGLLYGEAFGPTGVVPTLWLRPLDEPERLLVAGLLAGGALLAMTFGLSIVNRWREGGPGLALYDPSGVAGGLLLAAVGAAGLAIWSGTARWWIVTAALAGVGAVLVFAGLFVRAGARAASLAEAVIELFDTLLRLGSNVVSFTRLAAFGLTHAVISEVVWDGTVALWDRSSIPAGIGAVLLFCAGNAAAFALGALVAAIQALRLEYYELFSRLFASSGRPFTPWHLPVRRSETP